MRYDELCDASKEEEGLRWLKRELRACMEPILAHQWILDIDVTVKSIYGHQQGAEIGYNAKKPERPSHCYHSYFMANTRLCLGVDIMDGKKQASRHGLGGLWNILETLTLPRTHWLTFLPGDCNYGNQEYMRGAEERLLPYLFKLRHTLKVKTLIRVMQGAGAQWQDAGDGWEVLEGHLKLAGWSIERRVVLIREKRQ